MNKIKSRICSPRLSRRTHNAVYGSDGLRVYLAGLHSKWLTIGETNANLIHVDQRQGKVGALNVADEAFSLFVTALHAAHPGDQFLKGIEFVG